MSDECVILCACGERPAGAVFFCEDHDPLAEAEKLRARLTAVEAERDEAHRRHSEAEGQIACRNELRYRCARAEAELERLRAVVEAARQAYRADAVAEWFDAEGDGLRAALAALDAESEKKGGK